MPPSEPSRVFLSYARKDGAALAQRLHQDLTDEAFVVWLDVQRLTGGDIWRQEIAEAIDRADVVLALLSAGSYTSDVCRVEQQRALEKSKPIIPILVQSDCELPDYLKDFQRLDFTNLNLYLALLPKLIASIQKQAGEPLPPVSVVRYNNAPALPENFVNRPELLEALRNMLFTEGANRNIALTAMQGMGGIGKTVLAQALCRDEVVQQAFPDGIFWFAIGKESQLDFPARIKSVPGLDRLLGSYDGEAACLAQYHDVLRKKAALIVVDDVWRASDVQPFIAESLRSRLLITTRDTSIKSWVGAREFIANLLTEAESRQVLANWCGRAAAELPPQASEVIHECGYLPLALAMIGAQLRGKPLVLWNSVLESLRNADLQKIRAQFPEPHTTLFRAIQISVDALDETACQRYLALAVLLEDMAAAPQVQQCIWGVDETEAAEAAEQFIALSLAQRVQPEGSIKLHDLQLDYVRAQCPLVDREAWELIHGAIRLASHVIGKDPEQFASQMAGRLLTYRDTPAIEEFTKRVVDGMRTPWLRSMQPVLHPPGTALLRTLQSRSKGVRAVAVTRDGQRAVSASGDHTLKVWDLGSGRELRTLSGHSGTVWDVALSGDGRLVVSASEDKTLKVWDLASGRELRTLSGHSESVDAVAVTPDGLLAVSGSWQELKVWDLASGRELRTLKGHEKEIWDVALSGDGRLAVSASEDKTLKVWDLGSRGECAAPDAPRCHGNLVMAVAVTPDGQRAISGSWQELKVWDLRGGCELHTLKDLRSWVWTVAVTPDGRCAISSTSDETLNVWEVESGCELRTLSGHTSLVYAVAVTPDGQQAVSASSDQTLKVWEVRSGQELRTLSGHTGDVKAVAVTPGGKRAVSASSDRMLKLWDLASGRELRAFSGHTDQVTAVAVTPDGQQAVSASRDQTLRVWDLSSGRTLRTLSGHAGNVNAVAVMPDGQRVLSVSDDQTLKVWDLETGTCLATFTCDSAAYCCAYSDALKLIVAGDAGGHLHFLRLEEPKAKG